MKRPLLAGIVFAKQSPTNPTPYRLMFGPIGMQELMIVLVLVLLLFGAKKIPELARNLGKAKGEFSHAKRDFEEAVKDGENEAVS